jgi:hypothetical protein
MCIINILIFFYKLDRALENSIGIPWVFFYRSEIHMMRPVNNGTRMVLRNWYGMTLLGNDVLVCGGENSQRAELSSCDLYNASINEWAAAATIQPLPVGMSVFPMITLHTRPYVFGGNGGNVLLNTVYTFDASNVWATRTLMERAVYFHTAVALDTNTALVCGGNTNVVLHQRFRSVFHTRQRKMCGHRRHK